MAWYPRKVNVKMHHYKGIKYAEAYKRMGKALGALQEQSKRGLSGSRKYDTRSMSQRKRYYLKRTYNMNSRKYRPWTFD